ncbi:MAG: hypothetical protein ABW104_00950 [Candidatus Thiodiazotropha sp. 6PLUC2]
MQIALSKITVTTLMLLFSHTISAEISTYPSPVDPLYQSRSDSPEPSSSNINEDNKESRFYPRPTGPVFQTGDEQLSCRELDQQLATLESDTYSAKPGFYEDPYTGASIFVGAVWAPGALAYLGYSGAAEYYENDRVNDAQNRIEALRRMKAKLHCYEY